MNLYQLSTEFNNYLNADTDEELALALADITADQIEKKAENWCQFLATVESTVEMFKAEEKRIATARKAMENKIERGKEYIKEAMLAGNIDKIKAGTFSLTIAKTAGSTIIYDDSIIPAQYLTYVPATTIPDKAAIKEAIKHGEEVPGARIETGFSLRIK